MRKLLLILLVVLALAACQNGGEESNGGDAAVDTQETGTEVTESIREATAVPATATPLPTPRSLPEQKLPDHIFPVPTRTIHIVQPGDTLSVIAAQYGVTVKDVSDANRIYNFDLIQVGDTLYIPPCE